MNVFGNNLVKLRKAKGISQKDLADKLEIPVTTLSGYENAGREPRYDLLLKIAAFLNVSVDDLLKEDLDTKFNLPIRADCMSNLTFRFIGDNLVVTFPHEKKENLVLAMQLAADFMKFTASLVIENGEVEMNKKFFLRFSDLNSKGA